MTRNHFSDRHPGEVYDLNGAPVVLVKQHAAAWGHTWKVRYLDDTRVFPIEPGMMELLSWELAGNVRGDDFVPVGGTRISEDTGCNCPGTMPGEVCELCEELTVAQLTLREHEGARFTLAHGHHQPQPITLRAFVDANELEYRAVRALLDLVPGQYITYGGGAFAVSTLRRES